MIKITEQEFQKLSKFIKENYGINLKEEKKSLVTGRLGNTLIKMGFKSFDKYYEYIVSDTTGKAISDLINKISTNHTFFMREAAHFNFLKQFVLPYLKTTVRDYDIRIWSAGCSSGQEPYTLAMIIDEFFGTEKSKWNTDILATDISSQALEKAKQAIYTKEEIEPLPQNWNKKYFKLCNIEHYCVTDEIKKQLIIRKFNLMDKNFPFRKKFHVIFCRNVMIYFDVQTKLELVEKFYHNIEVGGYLFIGHSESLGKNNKGFRYIQPAIYRKE